MSEEIISSAYSFFNLPENLEIIALLPIGYPAEDAKPSDAHDKRNSMEEIVYWNEF